MNRQISVNPDAIADEFARAAARLHPDTLAVVGRVFDLGRRDLANEVARSIGLRYGVPAMTDFCVQFKALERAGPPPRETAGFLIQLTAGEGASPSRN